MRRSRSPIDKRRQQNRYLTQQGPGNRSTEPTSPRPVLDQPIEITTTSIEHRPISRGFQDPSGHHQCSPPLPPAPNPATQLQSLRFSASLPFPSGSRDNRIVPKSTNALDNFQGSDGNKNAFGGGTHNSTHTSYLDFGTDRNSTSPSVQLDQQASRRGATSTNVQLETAGTRSSTESVRGNPGTLRRLTTTQAYATSQQFATPNFETFRPSISAITSDVATGNDETRAHGGPGAMEISSTILNAPSDASSPAIRRGKRVPVRRRRKSSLGRWRCEICNQFYSRKDNLRAHFRIHSGEKPYQCNKCGDRFRWLRALRSHQKSIRCPYNDNLSKDTTSFSSSMPITTPQSTVVNVAHGAGPSTIFETGSVRPYGSPSETVPVGRTPYFPIVSPATEREYEGVARSSNYELRAAYSLQATGQQGPSSAAGQGDGGRVPSDIPVQSNVVFDTRPGTNNSVGNAPANLVEMGIIEGAGAHTDEVVFNHDFWPELDDECANTGGDPTLSRAYNEPPGRNGD